ncbi:hypothetical protein [Pseudoalteromonas luteoviolacea]|uniref:hypothetical protein n=1 Tax=Pseudoalteromonas luteoviolacea TaxID=43657 RepID=UPI001B36D90D|nr:hypothetical protein [Pseudoalteromonas luteoviolacea]MBQ4838492.1 hypothetical protein [Pseudoalteromonas luteoviolacea]
MKIYKWTNPKKVNLQHPFLYHICINTGQAEFNYIGKASKKSRLNEYRRNVAKILDGKARRPKTKRNGEPQSPSNLRYRYVHLVLALAHKQNWEIKHYPIENVEKDNLNDREQQVIKELNTTCKHFGLNEKQTWEIDELEALSHQLLQGLK